MLMTIGYVVPARCAQPKYTPVGSVGGNFSTSVSGMLARGTIDDATAWPPTGVRGQRLSTVEVRLDTILTPTHTRSLSV